MFQVVFRSVAQLLTGFLILFSTTLIAGDASGTTKFNEGYEDKAPTTALSQYIAKNCRQGCVDADLLMFGVERVSKEQGVDPLALLAIAKVESGFRPKAVNSKNGRSVGLMQIQVRWHKEKFRTGNHSDIMDNLTAGAMVYRTCLNKHKGSREKALHCYNGYQKDGMRKYVSKVMKVHAELAGMNIRIG